MAHAQLFTLTKEQLIEFTAQNPFERFPDGRPKVPDALIERARGLSAEEVLAVLPGKGFRNQYADGFRILHPAKKLVGRAFTVQFMPVRPDLEALVNEKSQAAGSGRMSNQVAIDMLQPGDVLVVDLFGLKEGGTIVGDNLCAGLRLLRLVRPIIRQHHEHLDGSGYPDQACGDHISLLAQMIGIVDVYDALISDRPYRAAVTPELAYAELHRQAERGWRCRDLVTDFIAMCRTGLPELPFPRGGRNAG